MKATQHIKPWIKHLVCALVYLLLFVLSVSNQPIQLWDEATYANNAIDLYENGGNPLLITHLGEPDPYNNKPPLVIMLQAACMHVFGITEIAVRLPSFVLGFLTVLLLHFFLYQLFGSLILSFISAIGLALCGGFMRNHVVLTGDLDGPMIFFTTLSALAFIKMLLSTDLKVQFRYLNLFYLSLFFAFLCKGTAGFVLIPALVIIGLSQHKKWPLLTRKHFRKFMFFLSAVIGIMLLTEFSNRGYLSSVIDNNLLRIVKPVMTWHVQPFLFYVKRMISLHYGFELLVILIGFFIMLKADRTSLKFRLSTLLLITVGISLLIISLVQVKLPWYDAPVYPLLAIVFGLSVVAIAQKFSLIISFIAPFIPRWLVLLVVGLALLIPPALGQSRLVYNQYLNKHPLYETSRLLKQNPAVFTAFADGVILFKQVPEMEHLDHVLFYVRAYNLETGTDLISVSGDLNQLEVGDVVFTENEKDLQALKLQFKLLEMGQVEQNPRFQIHRIAAELTF